MTVMTVEDGAITQAITRTDITTTAAVLHGTTGTEMSMGVDTKAETEENEATVLDQITTRNPRGEMIGLLFFGKRSLANFEVNSRLKIARDISI